MPNAADLSAGLFTLSFPVADFALALFIGALIGIEREKKNRLAQLMHRKWDMELVELAMTG